jgi:apolipoprotein D and lipocalin family protein
MRRHPAAYRRPAAPGGRPGFRPGPGPSTAPGASPRPGLRPSAQPGTTPPGAALPGATPPGAALPGATLPGATLPGAALLGTLLLGAALLTPAAPAAAQPRLLTVPSVDLARYAGTWHEVARLPNRFQAQCVAEVTAHYTPREDGTVAVVNRCRTTTEDDGEPAWEVAEGVARPVDPSNAKLQVSFLPAPLRWLPVGWGDYWVLDLDPEYRWALVGEPGRAYLWVLSRSPVLQEDVLTSVLGRAREMGFPVDKVVRSAQKPPTR